MKKILFALCALVLLSWVGGAVENSSAHPSDHSHKHIFSQTNSHNHSAENTAVDNFHCPMHNHRSLMPCPHKHSQKEMAHPKQCKIGPDCHGSPFKSVPVHTGSDYNPACMADMSRLDLPGLTGKFSPLRVAYDAPFLTSQKHPPKSL